MAQSSPRSLAGWPGRSLSCLLLLLSLVAIPAQALQISYCSSLNTGDEGPITNMYQSNGACQTTCQGKYAYAVLKGQQCWCSNWAPIDQVSTDNCQVNCPGFPTEKCGNPDQGLFGYFQLAGVQPSGTMGLGSATTSAQQQQSSTPPPSTSTAQQQASTPSTLTTLTTSNPVIITMPTTTATPFVSIKTLQGSVQTVVVTPTEAAIASQTSPPTINATADDSFWSNTGKVAGTFVAVALVILIILGLAIFFLVRRWRSRSEALAIASNADEDRMTSNVGGSSPPNGPPLMTDRRRSNLNMGMSPTAAGLSRGASNEKGGSHAGTPGSVSRQASIPLVHDQRLNPAALFNTNHHNGSHASVASFRDDRDYSRPVLHVRNPDPE